MYQSTTPKQIWKRSFLNRSWLAHCDQGGGCLHEQSALGYIVKHPRADKLEDSVLVKDHIFGMYRKTHQNARGEDQIYDDPEFLRFVVGKQNFCHVSGMVAKLRLHLLRDCLELSSQVTRLFPVNILQLRSEERELLQGKAAPP